jgi:hypothetical protein
MFDDIDKTLQLVHTTRAAPNFLLALGLSCYTEYWGKLLLGTEKKERRESSKIPFITFLKGLDCSYYEGLLKVVAILVVVHQNQQKTGKHPIKMVKDKLKKKQKLN